MMIDIDPSIPCSLQLLSVSICYPTASLLFHNLYPCVSINTHLLPSLTASFLSPSLPCITFFHPLSVSPSVRPSIRLSLLTVAIIKSCPVGSVAHGSY